MIRHFNGKVTLTLHLPNRRVITQTTKLQSNNSIAYRRVVTQYIDSSATFTSPADKL